MSQNFTIESSPVRGNHVHIPFKGGGGGVHDIALYHVVMLHSIGRGGHGGLD